METEKLASLLASAPADAGERLAPPAFLCDPRCSAALAIWRDYTPRLTKQNFFGGLDRHTFAIYCVYCAEFAGAQRDILVHGYSRNVKTISGDVMARVNPSVGRRATAQKIILEMARRFGLTPLDQFALIRDQASSGIPFGGSFTPAREPPAAGQEPPGQSADEDVIGGLSRLDSAPPTAIQ